MLLPHLMLMRRHMVRRVWGCARGMALLAQREWEGDVRGRCVRIVVHEALPRVRVRLRPGWQEGARIQVSAHSHAVTQQQEEQQEQVRVEDLVHAQFQQPGEGGGDGQQEGLLQTLLVQPAEGRALGAGGVESGVEVEVEAHVPQQCDCEVQLHGGGDIYVDNKLEGSAWLSTRAGDVVLDKVRGPEIVVQNPGGRVRVERLVEGNSTLVGRSVYAKLLYGMHVSVAGGVVDGGNVGADDCVDQAEDVPAVDISASYAQRLEVLARPTASNQRSPELTTRLGTVHGRAVVESHGGLTIKDLNGSISAHCSAGSAAVHINALEDGSDSKISAAEGDVAVTLGGEVACHLRAVVAGTDPARALVDLPPTRFTSMDTDSDTGSNAEADKTDRTGADSAMSAVVGVVNKDQPFPGGGRDAGAHDTERFKSGKIDRDVASQHALDIFASTTGVALEEEESSLGRQEPRLLPRMELTASSRDGANVTVSASSWIDSILGGKSM